MSETAGTRDGPPMIIQSTQFMSVLRKVLDDRILDKKTQKEWKDYRNQIKKAHWPLAGLTNKVDSELWTNMCEAALTSMIKHIHNSQPNGEWKLGEYEVDIRPNPNGDESIILACKWIDANNAMLRSPPRKPNQSLQRPLTTSLKTSKGSTSPGIGDRAELCG